MHSKQEIAWGVAMSAPQTEGATQKQGRGLSVWDEYALKRKRRQDCQKPNMLNGVNFFEHYEEDVKLMASLGIRHFRTSFSWSRIMPEGTGAINPDGIDFYHRLLDACEIHGVTPWITIYHWDLPAKLQQLGGWTNRKILQWFHEYVDILIKNFGHRINYWMVLNEPLAFTGAGYFLGVHAPEKRGMKQFLPTVLHASLVQAQAIHQLKSSLPQVQVGTTFSMSPIDPYRIGGRDRRAAMRLDAVYNRLFLEPLLGYGFPTDVMPLFNRLYKLMLPGDEEQLNATPDFVGIQNYTREVARHAWYIPYVKARLVAAKNRQVNTSAMGWEINDFSLKRSIERVHELSSKTAIVITENGLATSPKPINEALEDDERITYLNRQANMVKQLKNKGLPIHGYFVWSWLDNVEWAEGFRPKFGLIHVAENKHMTRSAKKSAYWYGQWCIEQNKQPFDESKAS